MSQLITLKSIFFMSMKIDKLKEGRERKKFVLQGDEIKDEDDEEDKEEEEIKPSSIIKLRQKFR